SGVRYRTARPPTSRSGTPRSFPDRIRSTAAGMRSSSLIAIRRLPPSWSSTVGQRYTQPCSEIPASEDASHAGVVQTGPMATKPDAAAEALTPEELQLAARNHGMPLEALRYPVTPI